VVAVSAGGSCAELVARRSVAAGTTARRHGRRVGAGARAVVPGRWRAPAAARLALPGRRGHGAPGRRAGGARAPAARLGRQRRAMARRRPTRQLHRPVSLRRRADVAGDVIGDVIIAGGGGRRRRPAAPGGRHVRTQVRQREPAVLLAGV